MLPTVNGKLLLDCTEEDLSVLLDNPDYRENDYLDYKATFSFLDCPKTDPKRGGHLAEFRSDVCSFANANGGYLVYGIRDERGLAAEIIGVDIPESNTDRFELDRKNNLSAIMPKMPSIRFRFIPLSNGKFIVILYVQSDFYAPYLHIEGESDYRIFKRVGNGKRCVGYIELKNLFNQSLSVEKEVQRFREERIYYYKSMEDTNNCWYSRFMLLHILPDTFTDSSHNKNVFLMDRNNRVGFGGIFDSVGCAGKATPNVDGLRFPSYRSGEECRINNDCVVEVFQPLLDSLNIGIDPQKYPFGTFAASYIWDRIEPVVRNYISKMRSILDTQKIFVGISIIGCKNAVTESNFPSNYSGKIDRDMILCAPVVFENIIEESDVETAIKRVQLEYKLALGMKSSEAVGQLIQEVYPVDNQ
ncbi:MAG: ATP-binding protein [Oscillospiraceae bacterium]|nr:ATP-binding protein [Oscillospiraceae bacterium]